MCKSSADRRALPSGHRAGTYAAGVSERETRGLGTGDLEEFRSTGHVLVDAVAEHVAALPGRAVWQPLPENLRVELLSLPLPDGPTGLGPLAGAMTRDVLPYGMGNGHPAFFGWVNPPPSLAGVLASLTAAAMNPSVVSGDHADVYLERTVVRWLAELVGYPHSPGAGLLTSGGSAATIVCLAGARSCAAAAAGHDVRREGLAGGPRLLSYVPSEAHSCVRRAIELLGLGSESIRPVPMAGGRLDRDALRAAIAADRAAGGTPALLVGSAGTVNTGAIDPLEALADVAAAEGLWFHVDGAYGAFGVLDPAIAARYRGMERADSLALDPHKWLGVPVDAGCALVRRADDLREAFSVIPPYLRQDAGAEVGTFAEYGLEQTRPFRALKTWATIAARGRSGIVGQVVRANALALELAALVEREPLLELAADPETSIVAFRARPPGCALDQVEAVNRALPEAVQASGRAFVTGTVYEGRETVRACILHPGTTEADLATLVAEVLTAAGELAAVWL
jgi:aromatic-L-amino-acid/L-tryptophan decarboxylase